jgi:hypothetical protein
MATDPIITPAEYEAILRQDFPAFIQRCFHEVNPQTRFRWNWHIEVLAEKLDEIRRGNITRLIINIPPRHLKSLCASIALPAWWLGHDPAAQILCVSYAQDLSDKLSRDSRAIMNAAWYQRLVPTRLAADRQSMQEFATTAQDYRLATSVGGVLTGRGADLLIIDDPLKPVRQGDRQGDHGSTRCLIVGQRGTHGAALRRDREIHPAGKSLPPFQEQQVVPQEAQFRRTRA